MLLGHCIAAPPPRRPLLGRCPHQGLVLGVNNTAVPYSGNFYYFPEVGGVGRGWAGLGVGFVCVWGGEE